MTRQEVADLFKVKPMTVYTWDRRGLTKPYRVGRAIRYKRADIKDLPQPVPADEVIE